jgi:hypothetical protein
MGDSEVKVTISIVTAVKSPQVYQKCLLSSVPSGIEALSDHGRTSIAKVYNEIAALAEGDILGFVHEDVTFLDNTWPQQVERLFQKRPFLGVLGFVGSSHLTIDGRWWFTGQRHGRFYQRKTLVTYDRTEGIFSDVEGIDGLALFTPKKLWQAIKFDETIPGFHFYDVDYCTAVRTTGKKLGVLSLLLRHESNGSLGLKWEIARRVFQQKWAGKLPVR